MIYKFYENLLKSIRERQRIYVDRICAGTFDKFDEYKGVVGKLTGLKEAESLALSLYKEMYDPQEKVILEDREDILDE